MNDSFDYGLDEKNRIYIVTIVFVALLVFGPAQPYGLVIRFAYLAAIPALLWLALRHGGEKLNLSPNDNDLLNRGITAAIAGMLTVAAYQAATAKYHGECTQTVRDGQGGYECVGDTVTVIGPDYGMAFMWIVFAVAAFWAATTRRSS
ncbi:hypothetical protein Q4610_21540 [Sphingobium sp. HBC34]|jgi:disulfide bond formation protein DsbB|uniref:Uncharacterized protein n=1 Tax=Sphingobium cyanobacteriorum TaxID=3063954 RepID=A0ABT8ZSV9_9SPHN|nr:hypothetical protein [Sphingobium sp. HBC34]MDO7837619.1 hypothetical protein [Sphingobium sp. HBC34]